MRIRLTPTVIRPRAGIESLCFKPVLKKSMTTPSGFRLAPSTEKLTRTDRNNRAGGGWLRAGIFWFGLGVLTISHGAEAPPEGVAPPAVVAEPVIGTGIYPAEVRSPYGDDELIIPEIFQSHLPTTLAKYALRLRFNPHVGDLINMDHLRLTTGVRYGVTENWQIGVASDLYFSHGYGHVGSFDRYGSANLQLSTKVNLGQPWFAGWNVGTGFDVVFPTGRPPAELTDGLRHFMPYVTLSHRLERFHDIRVFWGLHLDAVSHTTVPGELGRNAFNESSVGVTGGWVIDRKDWHYTFEAAFDTTRLIGNSTEDVLTIRPGVMWEIPSRRHPNAKGHWVVGVALKSAIGPGGTTLGASLKVIYNRDLKRRPAPTVPARTP